jgi:hypothetical protein
MQAEVAEHSTANSLPSLEPRPKGQRANVRCQDGFKAPRRAKFHGCPLVYRDQNGLLSILMK